MQHDGDSLSLHGTVSLTIPFMKNTASHESNLFQTCLFQNFSLSSNETRNASSSKSVDVSKGVSGVKNISEYCTSFVRRKILVMKIMSSLMFVRELVVPGWTLVVVANVFFFFFEECIRGLEPAEGGTTFHT